MTLLRERVNFQVSRKRSFARAPNPLSTFAKFPIKSPPWFRMGSANVFYLTPTGPKSPVAFSKNAQRCAVILGEHEAAVFGADGPGDMAGVGFRGCRQEGQGRALAIAASASGTSSA